MPNNIIYDLAKNIKTARTEYKKTHAKDEYIQTMEKQLDEAFNLITNLQSDLELLLIKLKEIDNKTLLLNEKHKTILKAFVQKDGYTISDVELEGLVSFDLEYKIAFEELNNKYFKFTFGTSSETFYTLNEDRRIEVLKLFRE